MKIISSSYSVFPSPLSAIGLVFVQYVLTEGAIGDKAVYVGVVEDYSTDRSRTGEMLEWVAHNGNKLSYREALKIFPHLKEEEYRS